MCSLGLARSSSLLCSWSPSSPSHSDDSARERDTFFRPARVNTTVTSVELRSGRRSTRVSKCPSVGVRHAARARAALQRNSAPLLQRRNSLGSSRDRRDRDSSSVPSSHSNRAYLTSSTSCLPSETCSSSSEYRVVTTQLYSSHITQHGRPAGRKRWKRVPEITSVSK
ncbi:hypothetical protein FHG87_001478, partial [Trinorchestia longiramus]